MSLIKNNLLIRAISSVGNRTVYELKNETGPGIQTRLGDALNFLPHGVVVKSETGMGATTLEINANRNSIIVEPLRFTAQSKADKKPEYLFVGTRIGKKNTTTEAEILKYLRNPAISKKKIICVVDSLPKVLSSIIKSGLSHSDFFLMLDETDSLQLDSTFRTTMNEAFEIYKTFLPENRATVTATPLQFSDPDLASEAFTEFRYETSKSKDLTLILTADYKAQVYDEIVRTLTQHPKQKIFVALNSVDNILDIADHLVKEKTAKEKDIQILCSSSSKSKVRGWFSEITNEKLPGLINFATSAYYTGFDLQESYHLIAVICAGSKTLELSEMRYKQISGRCRTNLLSETIVYQGEGQSNSEVYDFASLSSMADEEIKAIGCFSNTYSPGQEQVLEHMLKIRSVILKAGSINKSPLVYEDKEKNLKKAYLAFDSILESSRLRSEVFPVVGELKRKLENLGFRVKEVSKIPTNEIGPSSTLRKNDRETLEILDHILKMYLHYGQSFDPRSFTGFVRTVLEMFQQFQPYVEENYLVEILQTGYKSVNGGEKRMKDLMVELDFATTPDTEPMKSLIKANFEVGKRFSKDTFVKIMTNALYRAGKTPTPDEAWAYTRRVFSIKDRGNSEYQIQAWVIDPNKVTLLESSAI